MLGSFDYEGLRLSTDVSDDGTVTLSWIGVSDSARPALGLRPYLTEFSGVAEGKPVVLDFRQLQFGNSSTITEILNVIRSIRQNAESLIVKYDAENRFQKGTFTVMRRLGKELVSVQFDDT